MTGTIQQLQREQLRVRDDQTAPGVGGVAVFGTGECARQDVEGGSLLARLG